MAQPLYFLPHLHPDQVSSVSTRKAMLRERGLLDVFADVPLDLMPCVNVTGRGPGDLSGAILYYQSPKTDIPRRSYYKPSEQEWKPIGDGSQVWIGIDPSDPPTPDDLVRRQVYDGYDVELADGKTWKVPVIRRCHNGSTNLPTDMIWDATGALIEPIKPAYEQLWKDTETVVRWFTEERDDVLRSDCLRYAVKALSINYRYGPNEQNIVRAIDTTNYHTILQAMVDFPTYRYLMDSQKKMSDPSSEPDSTPGSTAETPTTDLAAAN
jgi:hypothetical protein